MYDDLLRNRMTLQKRTLTADGGGGQTSSWDDLLSLPMMITSLSGRAAMVYEREGFTNVMRILASNDIRRTQGTNGLRELLYDSSLENFRVMYRGRTLTIVAVVHPSEGLHDTIPHAMYLDCIETPMPVGEVDAT